MVGSVGHAIEMRISVKRYNSLTGEDQSYSESAPSTPDRGSTCTRRCPFCCAEHRNHIQSPLGREYSVHLMVHSDDDLPVEQLGNPCSEMGSRSRMCGAGVLVRRPVRSGSSSAQMTRSQSTSRGKACDSAWYCP